MFYTQEVERVLGGAIEFKDAKSGARTVLQNSQVLEVDRKIYDDAVKPAKAPAPAPQ